MLASLIGLNGIISSLPGLAPHLVCDHFLANKMHLFGLLTKAGTQGRVFRPDLVDLFLEGR